MPADTRGPSGLDALQTLLATARGLLTDLTTDPLLERILGAFRMLPESDREPILRVLEKDAAWRRVVEETSAATDSIRHRDVRAAVAASLPGGRARAVDRGRA